MADFERKKIDASLLKMDTSNAPEGSPFLNKKVVFTGDLQNFERIDAASIVQKLGGDVNTSISSKTNIVIMGKGAGPSKLEKIIDLLSDGIHIQLMNERIFISSIEPYRSILL